jgi:HAD superfamily hydrolase (TIGR01509 family)
MFDAVLFDVGSTLIHPDPAVLVRCLARQGVRDVVPQDALAAFLLSLEASREALPRMRDDLDKEGLRWAQLLDVPQFPGLAAFRDAVSRDDLYVCVDQDARIVLEALRAAGMALIAVANDNGGLARQLDEIGLSQYFDAAVDSMVMGVEKPHPAIFHAACKTLGIAPERACFVGDGPINDMLGAWSAGIGRCLLYDPHDIRPEVPDAMRIRRLSDVIPAVSS